MNYCSLSEVREYLRGESPDDNNLINRLIDAASSEIDRYCKRSFYPTPGTQYFDRFDDRRLNDKLYLDEPIYQLNSVINGNNQVIPSGSVWLMPRNDWPYQWIQLKSMYVWTFNTDGLIQVSGTFGWLEKDGSILQDIKQATIELTSYLYRLKDASTFDVVAFPEMGQITVPQGWPKHVNVSLSRYRRHLL